MSRHRVRIDSLYEGLYDGPHATPKPSDIGPVFLGIGNVTEDGHLDLSQVRHIAEEDFPVWTKRVLPQQGDIIFTYEATLNRYAIIPQGFRGCLGRRLALIRPDAAKVNPKFLFFYFFSEDWRKTISKNILSGATVDRIPLTNFPTFEVDLPTRSTQDRITNILSAYDDLIENNTRRIRILEQMAQMLYREWFVNFQFPGHEKVKMVESEVGLIPEGWSLRSLSELCSKVIDGTHDTPPPVSVGYPLVTGKHFTNGFIDFDSCYFISPQEHEKVMRRSKPEKGDILFSNIGTLGSIAIVPDLPKFSIKNVALFKPRKDIYSCFLYLYFALPETLKELSAKASGTSQRFFSLQFLRSVRLVTPPGELLNAFDSRSRAIVELRLVLNEVSRTLRTTRDLLLPKLVSGEVNIEQLEPEALAQTV